jgi:hypothetical protein
MVGVICVLVAGGVLAFALLAIGEEADTAERAAPFDGGTTGTVGRGHLVIVEGKVSAKNSILVQDFVDAAKEHQDNRGSWTIRKEYRQPILVDLARGEILLTAAQVCTRAKDGKVLEAEERSTSEGKIRYVGLKRGDSVTATGTLTSLAPASLAVRDWYSGSVADYMSFLTSSRKGVCVFSGAIAGLGVVFFLWGMKGRDAIGPRSRT